jgi:hypothetical protein
MAYIYEKMKKILSFIVIHISVSVSASCRIDTRKMSFFPRTVRDWNLLPPDIVELDTPEAFKASIVKSSHKNNIKGKCMNLITKNYCFGRENLSAIALCTIL